MNRHFYWLIALLILQHAVAAQTVQSTSTALEQQLENTVAESTEAEDDMILQQLERYRRDPLDLNRADENELTALMLLSTLQVYQFIQYRERLGWLVDVLELQAVPGWDIHTIRLILPYVRIGSSPPWQGLLQQGLRKGEHSILLRASQVLEASKGYKPDPGTVNYYPGSPQKIFLRYSYAYKTQFQYGLTAEKDAGEQFFRGGQQRGFDFYSFHVFMRNQGLLRVLAVGDFTVNMGQGLIQWQSLAFRKNADAIKIKRESPVLRPYSSSGEFNFYRGGAVTLGKRNLQATVFASMRKLDANIVADSTGGQGERVTSLQSTGLHRTLSELADKSVQQQVSWGAVLAFRKKDLHLSLNTVQHSFRIPFLKNPAPYTRYESSGSRFGNYSIDFSYTYRNLHLFGEAAVDHSLNRALLAGLIASAAPSVDLALLYRNIPPAYQAVNAAAFTENASVTNERGLYAGLVIRPGYRVRFDAYIDIFRFPWLKYLVDAPSGGSETFVELRYAIPRKIELYARYQVDNKPVNDKSPGSIVSPVSQQYRKRFRLHLSHSMTRMVMVRARVEITRLQGGGSAAEDGFLGYLDFLYQPARKRLSGSARFQYFETGGYDSRIYAYENDVLYHYSIPAFYNKGYRYYVNINYDIAPKWRFWLRWSQTLYRGQALIGSGLDEITGGKRSELRFQVQWRL